MPEIEPTPIVRGWHEPVTGKSPRRHLTPPRAAASAAREVAADA
jgi:hypothetical protein